MENFTKLTKQKLPVLNGKTLKNFGFKFAFLLLTFTMMLNVKAQLNIAPAATASASTCNTGACSTLNDNLFGTCGTQIMWITSSATNPGSAVFIQFTWLSMQRMNKITIHAGESANRFLGGGTIQIWNGSAWVNHSTFTQSTGVCNYDINFPAISTTQLRIVDIVVTGTQSSNANFREIQIWSAPSGTNDAGVASIDSPYTYCSAGNFDVKATIRNFGVNQISGVTVNWSVNGSLQTPLTYTSLLDTAGGSGAYAAQVTLGTYSFPSNSVVVKAWTSLPNSVVDTARGNDTSTVTKSPSMSGVYTINPSGSGSTNFTTFAAAISSLISSGVCGPVVFNVAPATYNITSAIVVPVPIAGVSYINTITFEGTSAVNRIVTGNIATSAILFVQCNYVTFRNITFTNTSTTNCGGIAIVGVANRTTISNCVVNLPNVSSLTSYAIFTSAATTGYTGAASSVDSLTLDSNTINGGYYGLYLNGFSTTAGSFGYNRNFKIRRNTFNNIYYYGAYIYAIQNGFDLLNNTFNLASTAYYGLYMYYCYNHGTGNAPHRLIGNKITGSFAYNYMYYFSSTINNPTLVYNNMIGGTTVATTNYGLYCYNTTYNGYFQIYHNTFNLNNASGTAYGLYYYNGTGGNALIKNNIFSITSTSASSGYPLYCSSNPTTSSVNYNTYFNASNANLVYRNAITYTSSNFMTNIAGGDTSWNLNPGFINNATNLNMPDACAAKNGASYLLSDVPTDIYGTTRTAPLVGAHEASSPLNDMSMSAILSPMPPVVAGSYPVTVRVKNTGSNTMTYFNFNYTLNGGTPVTEAYTGSGLNACDTLTYTFSSPVTLVNSNNFKFYTSNPNFTADGNRNNDTIITTMNAALAGGNYTINPSGSGANNFTSFPLAIAALSYGITGRVIFTVSPGTYSGQIVIPNVIGASALNNVEFNGVNKSTTILSHTLSSGSTLVLNACKYVTFRNFTITNIFAGACQAVSVFSAGANNAAGNKIVSCNINLPNAGTGTSYGIATTNSTTYYGSASNNVDSLTIDSNTFNNAYYGIYLYGASTTAGGGFSNNRDYKIRYNTMNSMNYMGMYIYYIQNGVDIIGNNLNLSSVATYGIYFYYNYNYGTNAAPTRINNNTIIGGNYSIYYYYNASPSALIPNQIYNNMLIPLNASTNYGMYVYVYPSTPNSINIMHNTAHLANATAGYGLYFYNTTAGTNLIKNNIIGTNSSAVTPAYFSSIPVGNTVNYNVYYNNGGSTAPLVYRNATTFTSANYKTTTAGGDSSWNLNPNYVNFANNLRIVNGGCFGRGVNLSANVPLDIDGNTRSISPSAGCSESVVSLLDMAVVTLLAPSFPVSLGTQDVTFRVQNLGATPVTSFDYGYRLNGGTPVSQTYTSSTLNTCDTVSLTVATQVTLSLSTNTLKTFTASPNYSSDTYTANDTLVSNASLPLNGIYTIGATASNYTTFNNAILALQTLGVSGPVTFNVRTGTYAEQINMTSITGASANNPIIFQSMANNRDSVIISPIAAAPYIWQFSSSSFITLKNLTLRSTTLTSAQNGINIVGGSSFDTIVGCKLDMAIQTSYANYTVYGTSLTSSCNGITFKNNIINGGYYGIYMYGTTNTLASRYWNLTVDNNTIANQYAYGFYSYYSQGINFTNNNVTTSSLYSGQIWYFMYADSFTFTGNKFNLLNNLTMYLGYYSNNGTGIIGRRGLVANNSFVGGVAGGTTIYMGYYSTNIDYLNNSINILSTTQAAYIYNLGGSGLVFRNNIFSNRSTGSAAYFAAIPTATTALMNNNNYFTVGTALTSGVGASATLPLWRTACNCDKLSISYRPAFISLTDNTPNPADTAVWAINGRGEYFAINPKDINGVLRPANIVDGAPDLGAYNVNPAATTLAPTATATPATPTAGTTQVFTLGFDTVASITWDAFTTPPATIAVRQYSGAAPLQIGSSVSNFPYFYTSISAPAGTYLYDAKINYRDNWMGTMYTTFGFTEDLMRLANKEVGVAWNTNSGGLVDTTNNNLTYSGFNNVTQMFTGSDIYNPLPVKLTSFNGSLLNNDAKLTWTTASEINANMFVVERSIDGKNFTAITNVKAAGNTSSLTSYNHLDKGIITLLNSAGTIYYRLKMVDNDNSFSYSKTIEIKTAENTKEKVTVTPNPFTTDLTITVETVNNANGTVEVSDINGRIIISQNIEVVKGSSTITINGVDKLKQGIYFVRYTTESNTQVFKMLKN